MRVSKLFRLAVLFFVCLLILSAGRTSIAQTSGSWTLVNSPNPGSSASRLSGVAAIAANNVWAVGHYLPNGGSDFENLAMRWDGSQWMVIPTPHANVSPTNILKKVIALSPNDVWAVGGHQYAYTMHWNGTAWSVVDIGPVPGGNTPMLNDISAVSPNDIWAVGQYASNFGRVSTVIMHWNGSTWTRVPSPDAEVVPGSPRSSFLWSVKAISANNVWAVGEYLVGDNSFTLIEHWNGTQWSIIPSPNDPVTNDGRLYGISVISANDIWAVGERDITNFNGFGKSLAMHWNGSQWSVVPTPHPAAQNGTSRLSAVTALSANDVWAVGTASNPAQGLETFIIHWNGTQWSRVTSPNVPPEGSTGWNQLQGIAAISPGDIWTVGYGQSSFGTANVTITEHYTGTLAPHQKFDMDGDGKTDVAVFRPANGTWYILNSSNNSSTAQQFGVGGDLIAPGDYDGDGKTDRVVFRPSTGYWYILNSSNASLRAVQFGQSGDVPLAGDYDGDGKADISLYRASVGTFYLLYSSDNSFHSEQWGQAGDVPVMGDYDEDGKTDFAIFRPSASTFYILRSSDRVIVTVQFGTNGDKPIAADFDGDGKTDICVYRPSAGMWYYLQSSDNSFRGIAWGTSGDVPVAGDYDGDGKWDTAVFRPSTGIFYILQSMNNASRAEQFGINGDVPVPSAFVP